VDANLRRSRVDKLANLSHPAHHDCWQALMKVYPCGAGAVHTLERYLAARGLIVDGRQSATTPLTSSLSEEYTNHLREVRGFAASTVSSSRRTAQCFLQHPKEAGNAVGCIRASNIESYIAKAGRRLSRASFQHEVAALRGFLRFLTIDGRVPAGFDRQIDTPRLYRLEQLPRALPWETVRTLLQSMDMTSPMGLRDYAMFLLIATCGLRASEVVAISRDDIRWRRGVLRIHQRKTSSPLELPLTNEVLSALVKHLNRTPPPAPYRRVFLRMRAPIGVLKPTAVAEAFQALVRKSGLSISYQARIAYVIRMLSIS
jgi:site-specific recombinase XerD